MALTYSINDLERLTGIRAHTIRIWEKRYGLLEPARTETNIRVYDDHDLRKILNVNTLLSAGWKISKVSSLSAEELEEEVWNTAQADSGGEQVFEIYTQALISAALTFDEDWFESVFADVTSRFGIPVVMERVITPFLRRIGLMWAVMKLHPGQEHFASNLIRRKILAAIDRLPGQGSRGRYLIFLPPWEEHEIGLLYAWYILRAAQYQVIYLGQRVPREALEQTILAVKPDALMTFLVSEEKDEIIQSFLGWLRSEFPDLTVHVASDADRARFAHEMNMSPLMSPDDLLDIL